VLRVNPVQLRKTRKNIEESTGIINQKIKNPLKTQNRASLFRRFLKKGDIMEKFITKPDISMYAGVTVKKDTVLEFKNENVDQKLENLIFRSITKVKGENYESTYDTTIYLQEGDILIFEEEGRGYIKPVENFVTVEEAIEDFRCIGSSRV
jgi:hypothetical protein